MRKVAVIGAGKIGSTVASLLVGSGGYEALLIDQDAGALAEFQGRPRWRPPPWRSTIRALAARIAAPSRCELRALSPDHRPPAPPAARTPIT
jgi:3-hydroxyacyl-CoA dehydrogenase